MSGGRCRATDHCVREHDVARISHHWIWGPGASCVVSVEFVVPFDGRLVGALLGRCNYLQYLNAIDVVRDRNWRGRPDPMHLKLEPLVYWNRHSRGARKNGALIVSGCQLAYITRSAAIHARTHEKTWIRMPTIGANRVEIHNRYPRTDPCRYEVRRNKDLFLDPDIAVGSKMRSHCRIS